METDEYTETTAGGASPGGPLRRDPEDRVVAGVCSGLGRHFGIDPVIFRIGFVALTLAGAAGLVVYGLAWLFIPEHGEETSKAAGLSRHRIPERTLGWGAGILAALVVLKDLGDRPRTGGLAVALVLGGVAVLLITRSSGRDASGPPAGTSGPPPATEPPGSFRAAGPPAEAPVLVDPSGESAGSPAEPDGPARSPAEPDGPAGPSATWPAPSVGGDAFPPGGATAAPPATAQMWPPAVARAPKVKAPPSPLGRITVSVLAIVAGVALFVDRAGWADVSLAAFLSLALLGVGVALVPGTWWGRSRGLIALGVLLGVAAAGATVVDVPLGDGVGDRTFRPAGVAALEPSYRLAMGELTVDLRDAVPAAGTTETVTARVGVGHLVVIVPDGVAVVVDGEVAAGELDLLGRTDEGTTVRSRVEEPARRAGAGRIDLRVSAGAGQVEVVR